MAPDPMQERPAVGKMVDVFRNKINFLLKGCKWSDKGIS